MDWKAVSLITATLFLNLAFWDLHGLDFPMRRPLLLYGALLAVVSIGAVALFFIGPALAVASSGGSLVSALEEAIGKVPAAGLRLCCVLFIALWIGMLISPILWFSRVWFGGEVSDFQRTATLAGVLVFIFVTALQSTRISAKQAIFSNKFAMAILVAALLRVRDGWPRILVGFPDSQFSDSWTGFTRLAFYVAPVAFLTANYGSRLGGRIQCILWRPSVSYCRYSERSFLSKR